MHVLSSFPITVIRYVSRTSAACTNDLSIIIVIGKGRYGRAIVCIKNGSDTKKLFVLIIVTILFSV
ncbi:hypothetical protein COJ50_19265 [Bacillus cereus]|uniref:Uncharacterized protein n=1 Tax=Bacillus cereus TaxID=1396 RepID=A0A2B1KDA8_BACCE|nr:hypothetical protein COJ50_19265 [Bacillus cereus]